MRTLCVRCLLLLFLLSLTANARAQAACPWLTQGTAEASLQGSVTVSTHLVSAKEGTCTFTMQRADAAYTLKIIVAFTNEFRCPDGSRQVPGIGNEAAICSANTPRNQTTDTLSSMIRDRFLTVQLKSVSKRSTPLTPEKRQTLIQQTAEEVAGNLF